MVNTKKIKRMKEKSRRLRDYTAPRRVNSVFLYPSYLYGMDPQLILVPFVSYNKRILRSKYDFYLRVRPKSEGEGFYFEIVGTMSLIIIDAPNIDPNMFEDFKFRLTKQIEKAAITVDYDIEKGPDALWYNKIVSEKIGFNEMGDINEKYSDRIVIIHDAQEIDTEERFLCVFF